jgi:transposase
MTALYGGIDLHSNNSVVVVMDAGGKVVYRRRLDNDLRLIKQGLAPYREQLAGVVVESTFNWYWLVDGLMEAGYEMKLANTTAIEPYSGLKHTDDDSDAEWLAEMLRLGILPTGYIYPKEERGVRDLLRKRAHLVRQRTSNVLSVQNLMRRSDGRRLTGAEVKRLRLEELQRLMPQPDVALAMGASVTVLQCLEEQIKGIEKGVRERVKLRREFELLQSTPGIGDILALTVML